MVAPSGEDRILEYALRRFEEQNTSATLAAPGAMDRRKSGRAGFHPFLLLGGSKFDHAASFIGVAESGEDFSGDAKVGVVHVLTLLGFWQCECKAAEVGWSGWHDNSWNKYRSLKIKKYKTGRWTQQG